MSRQSAVGVYEDMSKAEEAIRELDRSGFPIEQVSIIARSLEGEKEIHGFVSAGGLAGKVASVGAWVGGLFTLLVGAAFFWVPGSGPLVVAGPLAAAMLGRLEGGSTGAAGGELLAPMVEWGVSRYHIVRYAELVKGGKYLVVAHGDPAEVARACDILHCGEPEEVEVHTGEES